MANSIQDIIIGIKNIEIITPGNAFDESLISQTGKMPFRKKLTSRNVLRASLSYILIAAVLWKVSVIGSSLLHLTENTIRLIALLLIVLFPFAILLAWLYERSPVGLIKTGSVASMQNPYTDGQKKPFTSNIFIALLLSAALALFLLFPKERRPPSLTGLAPDEKSIAVLPFIDLSQNHDKEYFSDGIMEEILNHLYKIGELKVTSRTSVMQYKGNTSKSIKEIAGELGVAHILEGSVRLQANKIRITVQLIRAETDEHLWAENYDREFSDIFSIQSEVAQEVARALKARISDEALRIIGVKPTSNSEAYDIYLKAYQLSPYIEKDNEEAIRLCNKAIQLDPDFSSPYSELAFRITSGATHMSASEGIDPLKAWQTAKPYIEKALVLNPDNGDAHMFMAWALLWFEWNFAGAEKEYEEVRRIFPNYSWTDYEIATGQFEQAFKGAILGVEIDSKNLLSWTGIITSAYFAKQNPDSIIRKVLTLPIIKDDIYIRSESARIYMYLKEYDKAISMVNQLIKDFPEVVSPQISRHPGHLLL